MHSHDPAFTGIFQVNVIVKSCVCPSLLGSACCRRVWFGLDLALAWLGGLAKPSSAQLALVWLALACFGLYFLGLAWLASVGFGLVLT